MSALIKLFEKAIWILLLFPFLSSAQIKHNPKLTFDQNVAASIRSETIRSWDAYKKYAWKHDQLKPLSKASSDWYKNPLYLAPIDGYATLKVMGFQKEADEIEKLVVDSVSFDKDQFVKTYEVYQRILGGLLCMYQYTHNQLVLKKAEDFGNRLLPAFDSKTGIPYYYINLKTGQGKGDTVNVAEGGSYLFEMGILSYYTKNPVYYQTGKKAERAIFSRRSKLGLVGEIIDIQTGQWLSERSHTGAYIDSYYEYMYKSILLFHDPEIRMMWDKSIFAINKYIRDQKGPDLWYAHVNMYTGKKINSYVNVWDAFFPGLLALSGDLNDASKNQDTWDRLWMKYHMLPERYNYDTGEVINPRYTLNPENIESAYYLYQFTRNVKYKQRVLKYYEDLYKYCRTDVAYTTINNVKTKNKGDVMETFFIAETMKYIYLTFADPKAFQLKDYVFTTEAHPFLRSSFVLTDSKKRLGY